MLLQHFDKFEQRLIFLHLQMEDLKQQQQQLQPMQGKHLVNSQQFRQVLLLEQQRLGRFDLDDTRHVQQQFCGCGWSMQQIQQQGSLQQSFPLFRTKTSEPKELGLNCVTLETFKQITRNEK